MNRWAHQQKPLVVGCVQNAVVCPKPRRITITRQHPNSKLGTDLLDIILTKVPSSPPFFIGSPPNRASNPVIQDEHFCSEHRSPLSPTLEAPSSVHKNGASVRTNFRPNLAPVRIEGFNCCGNSSISAIA